ncbi:uncharacterized protein FIESC28_00272 [Fusarium coffeatum]|uniref:Zn(2)-C6 fungal-type domain-containing protein n=1 Tax=Fusarium coffeatum TaxID=231269 RepID=A0A366SCG7_9HYPO|nr:uncharacterized protein FIESC28_00272 [Fusarium coffeatum]RBR27004.1 hypothetical protein FIESC28_00272 [Fusarium coffeatum]
MRATQRQRAFAPKKRTGCLTCKKRHKKCDEEKPICQRCKKGGYVCDGYEKQELTQDTPKPRPLPLLVAKRASTPQKCLVPGNALESSYYTYFFSDIIGQFEISHSLNKGFWKKTLLAPSQDNLCIKHAVLAVGATHLRYSRAGAGQILPASLDRFILTNYNEAISRLANTRDNPADLETILTCCILFVILESLRGDFEEAVRHLESGIKILANHKPKVFLPNNELQDLATIFHAISSQVAIFAEDRIFPDVTHLLMPPKKQKRKANGVFRDLDEAEDVMNKFDDVINHISWDLEQDWDDEESECVTQWVKLRQDVATWEALFNCLLGRISVDESKERILNLRIQHKLWEVLLDGECNEDQAAITPQDCNTLLDQVQQLWCNPSHSHFGLKIDLTAALYQLYVYCEDDDVRQRIINMLRSQRRREIIWDSGELADFLERDMWQRALGLQEERWPDIGPSKEEGALLVFRPKH